jgi:hypothetical protein
LNGGALKSKHSKATKSSIKIYLTEIKALIKNLKLIDAQER